MNHARLKRARLRPGLLLALASALNLTILAGPAGPAKVDFNRDVRPILAENCFACHGPDEEKRKAKLRLDLRDSAVQAAKSGAIPIVAGKAQQSELIKRVTNPDED